MSAFRRARPSPARAPAPPAPSRWRAVLRHGGLWTSVGVIVFGLAVTSTAARWSRVLRQPLLANPEEGSDAPVAAGAGVPSPSSNIKVKLFFESPAGLGLVLEEREVPHSQDLARQIELVVAELVRGSRADLLAPVPPETRVLSVFVTHTGVAYVNLSKEAQGGPTGSRSELLSVFAFVDTLTSNFPAVKRVQLLVEDRAPETLLGHVDLDRPLAADLTLLAEFSELLASPSPSTSSVAVPSPGGGATTP